MPTLQKEADVKREVKKLLTELGFWYFMPVQTGYGVQGVPDFIICGDGRFIAIETKFGSNPLSAHQEMQRTKIIAALGDYYVVTERNLASLREQLSAYKL
jgi:hypothetical protein